jgi:Phospholipase_D-nuclease N-terminal
MVRLLPLLLILAFTLYALIDCLARDEDEIRALPKVIWVLIILLFMPLGPVAWFIAGRPRGSAARPARRPDDAPEDVVGGYSLGTGSPTGRGGRPLAPDDDPEFLRRLDEQQRRRHRDETEDR